MNRYSRLRKAFLGPPSHLSIRNPSCLPPGCRSLARLNLSQIIYNGVTVCMYACVCIYIYICVCVCVIHDTLTMQNPHKYPYVSICNIQELGIYIYIYVNMYMYIYNYIITVYIYISLYDNGLFFPLDWGHTSPGHGVIIEQLQHCIVRAVDVPLARQLTRGPARCILRQ